MAKGSGQFAIGPVKFFGEGWYRRTAGWRDSPRRKCRCSTARRSLKRSAGSALTHQPKMVADERSLSRIPCSPSFTHKTINPCHPEQLRGSEANRGGVEGSRRCRLKPCRVREFYRNIPRNALMQQCRGHCTGVLRLYLAPLVARCRSG